MADYDTTVHTIKGEVTGEALISIWRHYPEHDLIIDDLVNRTIQDHQQYPSDIVKLSPNGRYCAVDFGCKIIKGSTDPKASGSTSCRDCIVKIQTDWSKITEIDPLDGHYGQQIEFVKRVSQEITDVPIMMTIFAPTMVARKLSNNLLLNHFREAQNEHLIQALKTIEKVTIEYGKACLDAGANGVFIAVQEADKKNVTSSKEVESILKYNENFVRTMNARAEFTVKHIHGDSVYFNEALENNKTTAINWHDQTSELSIQEARTKFTGGLFAGLDPLQVYNGYPVTFYQKLLKLKDEIPLIISPGCVLLQGTPESNIKQIFINYRIND